MVGFLCEHSSLRKLLGGHAVSQKFRHFFKMIKFHVVGKLNGKVLIHVENVGMKCQAVIGIHYFT